MEIASYLKDQMKVYYYNEIFMKLQKEKLKQIKKTRNRADYQYISKISPNYDSDFDVHTDKDPGQKLKHEVELL